MDSLEIFVKLFDSSSSFNTDCLLVPTKYLDHHNESPKFHSIYIDRYIYLFQFSFAHHPSISCLPMASIEDGREEHRYVSSLRWLKHAAPDPTQGLDTPGSRSRSQAEIHIIVECYLAVGDLFVVTASLILIWQEPCPLPNLVRMSIVSQFSERISCSSSQSYFLANKRFPFHAILVAKLAA